MTKASDPLILPAGDTRRVTYDQADSSGGNSHQVEVIGPIAETIWVRPGTSRWLEEMAACYQMLPEDIVYTALAEWARHIGEASRPPGAYMRKESES